ncbi:hypothetical protein CTI14_58300, partial [Methylobacterium radiotolerans]
QSTGQQLRALASKDIDVGFLRPSILFVPPPNIATLPLWTDRLMAALPQSTRFPASCTAFARIFRAWVWT